MQFTAVLSDHVDPSFLLSSPLSGVHIRCMLFWGIVRSSSDSDVRSIVAVCSVSYQSINQYPFIVWYDTSNIPADNNAFGMSIIPILIFSLLNISSFLILSLLVTPSIFRRHAISNTLSLCFCFSFIVHVSALYSRMLNTSTSYMRVFCRLAQFLGVPH